MKTTTVAALALATVVSAQTVYDLPQCAQQPVLWAISNSGCPLTDIECICKNENFMSGLIDELPTVCNNEEFLFSTDFAVKLCAMAGVEVTLPASLLPANTATTSAAAATTSAPASASTTDAPASTSAASDALSTASSVLSSVVSSISSAIEESSSSSAAASKTSDAPAAATSTGAASVNGARVAGVIGVAGAVAALL